MSPINFLEIEGNSTGTKIQKDGDVFSNMIIKKKILISKGEGAGARKRHERNSCGQEPAKGGCDQDT